MTEEENTTEQPPKPDPQPPAKLSKAEAMTLATAEANAVAERLEKANKETAQLLKNRDIQAVQDSFDGSASAGQPQLDPEKEKDREAKKMLEGTGFEEMLFPED